LNSARIKATPEVNRKLKALGTTAISESVPAIELLRRPEVTWSDLMQMTNGECRMPNVGQVENQVVADLVELEVKYEGYIERTKRQLGQFEELESIRIPERLDFNRVPGLSNEVRERLARNRPASVGMAQRMPGVTPAAIFALMAHLRKK